MVAGDRPNFSWLRTGGHLLPGVLSLQKGWRWHSPEDSWTQGLPAPPLGSGPSPLWASSCLARFFRHKSPGGPRLASVVRKGLNVMIPVPKPRNPRRDWARRTPCSPRERQPEEGSRAPWTPCSEQQEKPFCRRGIVDSCSRHLVPSCSEEGLTRCGPHFTYLVSSGLADVIGVSAHFMFFNFMQMSLLRWLLLLLPSTSSHNQPGVPSLWMDPRSLGEQRGACSKKFKSACHECYLTLTCFWSAILT